MSYNPEPIDTKMIKLPHDIQKITKILAKNAHELWAEQRIIDGWKWGPVRDDTRKEHPNIIPYDDLPESEKKYDQMLIDETLKALIFFGFEIRKT